MWTVVVTCALACCGSGVDENTPPPPEAIVSQLSENLQTGSLIFSRGDCLAVKIFSRSHYTHVGGVVMVNGEPIVYDSMNDSGVRKTPFVEYLRQQTNSGVLIAHPRQPLTPTEAAAFHQHLESQIGRKYAVKHHLTGQRSDGIHCAEYMTDALMAADVIAARQPARVSPGSLLDGITFAKLYTQDGRVNLKPADPTPLPPDTAWYQRAWHGTVVGCVNTTSQLRRWVLCR